MSSTTCSPPARSQSFDSWAGKCQISLGRQCADDATCSDTLLDLATSLPAELTVSQQERAGLLLARLFCRFVSALNRPIVSDLARGALADGGVTEWLAASQRLAGLVVQAACRSDGSAASTPVGRDARVERTLAEIERHFTNPRFGLRAAAGRVALSDCRLTQLLKAATGRTFGAHLHHRRVTEARTLLSDSALSIKEIAGRVGYQSTTQLDRHFKRIVGSLPSACRAASRRLTGTRRL